MKQKSETNNNTSSVNKTVTENDEILETERGNSGSSSNSKQKRKTQTEPSSKKKKIIMIGDSMVNGISEKGFSVNHKDKLDDIIKEQPDDLIFHVGTNDLTNNVNLLNNVKKSSMKFLKNHHRHPSHFHLSITGKTRRTSRKP